MSKIILPKIFVLHVKQGYESRRTHMESMLGGLGLDFEYVLDGDISDLNQERICKYFSGELMSSRGAHVSCAFKHMLVYERMKQNGITSALVLEDDIFLSAKFMDVFYRTIEQTADVLDPFYVCFEATCLKLVPRSQRLGGQVIYPAKTTQCTGAYYCNLAYATMILEHTASSKCCKPIDLYISDLGSRGAFKIFWSYPVVATQGSHNGRMTSSIDADYHRKNKITQIKRYISMSYKQAVYYFR